MYGTAAAIFSLLLVLTGVAKILSPRDVARAIGALGLPTWTPLGVVIGTVEVGVGVGALLVGAGLWAQGVLYAGFAGWIYLALRREVPLASCGCLGKDDTPPTWAHLVMNLIAVAVSLAAAAAGPVRLIGGLGSIAQLAVVAAGVLLAYIVLTDGARLVGVRAR
ncbi:MAG TPA: MauE/DoxX family redox-associated membrane protein [Acidimicrobiia bacterium]|nr:MauE/DoxX family redox-associated membrane protein [Acidimicrobiia bacterium]